MKLKFKITGRRIAQAAVLAVFALMDIAMLQALLGIAPVLMADLAQYPFWLALGGGVLAVAASVWLLAVIGAAGVVCCIAVPEWHSSSWPTYRLPLTDPETGHLLR